MSPTPDTTEKQQQPSSSEVFCLRLQGAINHNALPWCNPQLTLRAYIWPYPVKTTNMETPDQPIGDEETLKALQTVSDKRMELREDRKVRIAKEQQLREQNIQATQKENEQLASPPCARKI